MLAAPDVGRPKDQVRVAVPHRRLRPRLVRAARVRAFDDRRPRPSPSAVSVPEALKATGAGVVPGRPHVQRVHAVAVHVAAATDRPDSSPGSSPTRVTFASVRSCAPTAPQPSARLRSQFWSMPSPQTSAALGLMLASVSTQSPSQVSTPSLSASSRVELGIGVIGSSPSKAAEMAPSSSSSASAWAQSPAASPRRRASCRRPRPSASSRRCVGGDGDPGAEAVWRRLPGPVAEVRPGVEGVDAQVAGSPEKRPLVRFVAPPRSAG